MSVHHTENSKLTYWLLQVENSSIILTGAGALNKLLGREVYTSNTQLGGTQVGHIHTMWGVSGRLVDPSSCELIKGLLSVDVEHFGGAGVLCSTI